MSKFFWIVGGIWLGAGLMYVFDPDRGKRRRAIIRDKATDVLEQAGDAIEKKGNEIRKQAREFVADTRSSLGKTVSA